MHAVVSLPWRPCRRRAVDEFKKDIPGAQVEFMKCDLSDFGYDRCHVHVRSRLCCSLHVT